MIKIFFSYSHRDTNYRDELEVHLAMLKKQGVVQTWHDRKISAGADIHKEISEHLESANIVLLLVSPYFLASDYCYDVEMSRALERDRKGEATVIPVIIEPCDWKNAPFGHLRATPPDGKPVSKFANIHDAFLAVTQDIREVFQKHHSSARPPSGPSRAEIKSAPRAEEPRSSNLRLKHEFTDRERDKFLEESFEYLARFFENSLSELEERHNEVETRYQRVSAHKFTAAIYVRGEKAASCRVWSGDTMIGDIAYSAGDSGPSNSYNESLSVADDGYTLLLRPLGLRLYSSDQEALTAHGAAEHLWSILVDRLQ